MQRLTGDLGNLDRALAVLYSPTDQTASIDHARALYGAGRHPKSFISLAGADHLLSARGDGEWVGGLLAAWAHRYLEELAPKA